MCHATCHNVMCCAPCLDMCRPLAQISPLSQATVEELQWAPRTSQEGAFGAFELQVGWLQARGVRGVGPWYLAYVLQWRAGWGGQWALHASQEGAFRTFELQVRKCKGGEAGYWYMAVTQQGALPSESSASCMCIKEFRELKPGQQTCHFLTVVMMWHTFTWARKHVRQGTVGVACANVHYFC